MFGKKKIVVDRDIGIEEDIFCKRYTVYSSKHSHKTCFQTDDVNLMILKQNGREIGTFRGGVIYPFSADPRNAGTKKQYKQIRSAEVILINTAGLEKIKWGTTAAHMAEMRDPLTGTLYKIGANGSMEATIEEQDAGKYAARFYEKTVYRHRTSTGNAQASADDQVTEEMYTLETFMAYVCDFVLPKVMAAVCQYIADGSISLQHNVKLPQNDTEAIQGQLETMLEESLRNNYGLNMTKFVISGIFIFDPTRNP